MSLEVYLSEFSDVKGKLLPRNKNKEADTLVKLAYQDKLPEKQ